MSDLEYRRVSSIHGALMFLKAVDDVALGDRVVIRDKEGRQRNGQVIRTSKEVVMVQVFEGTDNLDLENTWVRFLD